MKSQSSKRTYRQAFAVLLEQVEVALQESLARSNAATQQGDFDTVEVEIERQKNLISARNQFQGLQELWPELVEALQQQAAEEAKLAALSHPTEVREATSSPQGRPIFARYKDRRYEAILLPNHRVVLDGEEYSSPSSAASAVAGGTSVNGWRFWRYVDEKEREQLIDALRVTTQG